MTNEIDDAKLKLEEEIKNNIRMHLKTARESLDKIESLCKFRLTEYGWDQIRRHLCLAQDAASYIEELADMEANDEQE